MSNMYYYELAYSLIRLCNSVAVPRITEPLHPDHHEGFGSMTALLPRTSFSRSTSTCPDASWTVVYPREDPDDHVRLI